MVESYNMSSNSSGCYSESNCTFCDEPTYINERQLIFKTKENDVPQAVNLLYQYPESKQWKAAMTIQRAYRLYLCRCRRKELLQEERDDANNYIEFLDECCINRRSGYSLTTTSNSASDSRNSDYDNDMDENSDELYQNSHIYESISYDLLLQSSPESSIKGSLVRESIQHNSQCPLSDHQRKFSLGPARLAHRDHSTHRLSEPYSHHPSRVPHQPETPISPHSPIHSLCHNTSRTCHYHPNIVSANSRPLSRGDETVSRSPHEMSRINLLRKQSKVIQNQRLLIDKRRYRVGLNILNKNPAAGINYLIKYQYITPHPSQIAKFLLTRSGISRNTIGDYIGSISDPLALQVTKFLLRRINMKNKEVDEALRSYIYYVHLPGESQKICHLMEEFKEAYLQQNKLQFKSKDTIMILAYAIIMLQTDAHNQSIRKNEKMTLEQFVTNLRGVDDNCDIDRSLLEHIYTRVSGLEMKTRPDHSDQVRRLSDLISSGCKPVDFVNRVRRFMCHGKLSEIVDETKKSKPDVHNRDVFLFNDILLITKPNNKLRKEDRQYHCKYALVLADIQAKVFTSTNHLHGIEIVNRNTYASIIKLSALFQDDQKKFMFDLSDCVHESLETLKVNCSELLALSSSQPQNSPSNIPINLAPKCSCYVSNKRENIIPPPPRRHESLITNDQPVYRYRNTPWSASYDARPQTCNGKPC